MYNSAFRTHDVDGVNAMMSPEEERSVIEFVQAYFKKENTTPSVRKLCKETNLTTPRFYRLFGSLQKLCEKAGIYVDQATRERLKISAKATRKRQKKAERKRSRVQIATTAPKDQGSHAQPAPTFEEIQRNLQDEEEARQARVDNVKKFVAQIELLALNENREISEPALEEFYNIIPHLLKKKHGVSYSVKDLIGAEETLHQARITLQKLQEKELRVDAKLKKNEAERLEIQHKWEKLKADPEKAGLLRRIYVLEDENKVYRSRLDESYTVSKGLRIVVNSLLGAVSNCNCCKARFVQNMAPHKPVLEWFLKGDWSLMSFETVTPPTKP
jgi:hypothetical protein